MLSFSGQGRVLVVGDVMLDRYVHGQVSRVSPEAPVPVLRWSRDQDVAGGAANVAANIAALGGHACIASIVGEDESAADLTDLLGAWNGRLDAAFVAQRGRPTTLKTRFVTNGQQLLRLDQEDGSDIAPESVDRLVASVAARLPGTGVVVLSDYRKGVLTDAVIRQVIELCKAAAVPVVVDPKRPDWSR